VGFKKDFVWGVATSSYQIEGAWNVDGRGESVWDAFTHQPGHIYGNDTGDIACDHYHLFREDVDLMASLGVKNYRFSLAWPRILPEGRGKASEAGLDFYDRLVDALLEKGIRPFVTLFHWDYPVALERLGGWYNPESSDWFAEYARLCIERLGDRAKDIITLNEPQCFLGLGYRVGQDAPGIINPIDRFVEMSHNVMLAHGKAVQAMRAQRSDLRIGYAPCGDPVFPATESEQDVAAARKAYMSLGWRGDAFFWSPVWFSDPVILGRYPEEGMEDKEMYLPKGWQDDLKTICQPLDFYCQNIYQGVCVRATDNDNGFETVPRPVGLGKSAMGWPVTPEALYWGPRFLCERYKLPFYISENGMSGMDWVHLDGSVHDPYRIDYTRRYLRAYRRCAEEGYPIEGYFHWSFLDNFEWTRGYNDRFGLVYVDYATQKRIPKDSALWYKQVMETNGECL